MTKSQAPNYKSFDLAQDPAKGIPSEVEGQPTISNDQKSKHIDTWYGGLLKFRYCKLFVICNLAIGIFTWIGTACVARAETIRLKSGLVIEGTVVARTADAIKIDAGIGVPVTYYLDEIETTGENPPPPAPQPQPSSLSASPMETTAPTTDKPSALPKIPDNASTSQQQESSSFLPQDGKELELYNQASDPAPFYARRLSTEEYLKEQFQRANALQRKRIQRAIQAVYEAFQQFLDSRPGLKKFAATDAGRTVGISMAAALYALLCFPLMLIARKLQCAGWMAWIPILQIFLVVRIAEKSSVWILCFFLPGVNLLAFLVVGMSIARRLEQPPWLGYLMLVPGANLIVLWYLALLPPAVPPPPKPRDNTDTGIRFD